MISWALRILMSLFQGTPAAGLRLHSYCWNILMTFLFMVPWSMEKVLQKKGYKGIKIFLKVMGLVCVSIRMSLLLGVAAVQERLRTRFVLPRCLPLEEVRLNVLYGFLM